MKCDDHSKLQYQLNLSITIGSRERTMFIWGCGKPGEKYNYQLHETIVFKHGVTESTGP